MLQINSDGDDVEQSSTVVTPVCYTFSYLCPITYMHSLTFDLSLSTFCGASATNCFSRSVCLCCHLLFSSCVEAWRLPHPCL